MPESTWNAALEMIDRVAAAHRATGGRTAAARRAGAFTPLARWVDEQPARVAVADAWIAMHEEGGADRVWAADEHVHAACNAALAAQVRADASPEYAATASRAGAHRRKIDVTAVTDSLAAPIDAEAVLAEAGEELIAAVRTLPYVHRRTIAMLREGEREGARSAWSRATIAAREALREALDTRRRAHRRAR